MSEINQQQGFVLLLCLIAASLILLITSIVVETTIINLKSQQAQHSEFIALKHAEQAIADCRHSLDSLSSQPIAEIACGNARCIHSYNPTLDFLHIPYSWWQQHAASDGTPSRAYSYIEQYQQTANQKIYYRISVLGLDNNHRARQLIQVIVSKQFAAHSSHKTILVSWRRLDEMQ